MSLNVSRTSYDARVAALQSFTSTCAPLNIDYPLVVGFSVINKTFPTGLLFDGLVKY